MLGRSLMPEDEANKTRLKRAANQGDVRTTSWIDLQFDRILLI